MVSAADADSRPEIYGSTSVEVMVDDECIYTLHQRLVRVLPLGRVIIIPEALSQKHDRACINSTCEGLNPFERKEFAS